MGYFGASIRWAVLAAALPACHAAAGDEGVSVFRGAPQNSGPSSRISYANPGNETFSEQWQLTAQLDDGAMLTVLFLVHNAGPGDGHADILMRYLPVDGDPVIEIVESEEPQTAPGAFELRFGQDALRLNDGAYEFSVRGSQMGFAGRLEPLAAPYTPGDGTILDRASGAYIASSVMVPRGRLQGELTTGRFTRKLAGYGYLDHAEATLVASDISRIWRSLRLHSAGWTVNFIAIDGLPGPAPRHFLMAQRVDAGGMLVASTQCTPAGEWRRADAAAGQSAAPWGFACRFPDGGIEARIVPRRIVDRSRAFDALPLPVRLAARLLSAEPYGYVSLHSHHVRITLGAGQVEFEGQGYDELLEFRR